MLKQQICDFLRTHKYNWLVLIINKAKSWPDNRLTVLEPTIELQQQR